MSGRSVNLTTLFLGRLRPPKGRYLSQVFDAFVFLRKHSVQTGDFSESFRNHFFVYLTTNMIVTSPPEYLHENAMQKNKKINLEEMAV